MLAACGGGSDNGGEDLIVSDGLLQLEYPADIAEQLAGTPLLETFNDLERVNETGEVDVSPSGNSIYTGTFGFITDNDGVLVAGDTTITVNGTATEVTTLFEPTTFDDGSTEPPTISGSFGGNAALANGYYEGGVTGVISAGDTDIDVAGDLTGVFATNSETIGSIEGSLTDQADPTNNDTFGALYYAFD